MDPRHKGGDDARWLLRTSPLILSLSPLPYLELVEGWVWRFPGASYFFVLWREDAISLAVGKISNVRALLVMITDVEDYFSKGCGRCKRFDTPECSAKRWQQGQERLREICKRAGLEETVKWAHPCYMHAGRNIVLMAAFQNDFRLNFFNAALMKDPEGVLERRGPNTQHPDMIRFTSNELVAAMEPVIRSYLDEAMNYAEKGIMPPKSVRTLELPEELVEALASDPELSEAFDDLTPGRQKSYVINLNSAKKPETRHARIVKFRDKIIAGKGAMER